MKSSKYRFIVSLLVLFLFSGCAAATTLLVGGAGEIKTDYFASFDQVWTACEKTVADMRGTEVQPVKEIAQGQITTVINDEKVKFEIIYRSKNQTSVSIRVGLVGNKLSSQLLHDKIAGHLSKI